MLNRTRHVIILVICLLLAGCLGPQQIDLTKNTPNDKWHIKSSCSLSLLTQEKEKPNVNQITISIYVDGTLSMLGYVDSSIANSRYARTLRLLKQVATTGWQDAKPKDKDGILFYHFGTKSIKLDEARYPQALKEDLYLANSKNSIFNVAQIESAIKPPNQNEISVIITDLYQKDTDISSVAGKLRKYLEEGLAVGILAIRSEFNGKIYDIGTRNKWFDYSTIGKKIDQYRPFFVIILGSYNHINNYYARLKEQGEPSLFERHELVIFYPKLVKKMSFFIPGKYSYELPQGKRLGRLANINNGRVFVQTDNLPIEKLDVTRVTDNNIRIIYKQIPYVPLDYALKIAHQEDNFKINSQVDIFDGSDSPLLKNALNLSGWQVLEQKISFTTEITPKTMKAGVYAYTIEVTPNRLEEPEWWKIWNADDNNLKDGHKTHNLLRFLQSLKAVNQELSSPIGRFCYIIQKK